MHADLKKQSSRLVKRAHKSLHMHGQHLQCSNELLPIMYHIGICTLIQMITIKNINFVYTICNIMKDYKHKKQCITICIYVLHIYPHLSSKHICPYTYMQAYKLS